VDSVTLVRIVAGILVLVLCLLYFYPTFKAMGKRNTGAIFALNLLTGWSIIGWVVALIWALKNDAVALRSDEVQQFTGRDQRIKGFIYILWSIVFLMTAFVIMNHTFQHESHISTGQATSETGTPTQDAAQPSAPAANEYHESDQLLSPYDISKNPYKFKDQSGILDTIHVPLVYNNGVQMGSVPYPGGALRFNKMIDERTAIYEVMVGHEDVEPDGEIAVILTNSDQPSSLRPWRVFVEGPMEAVNGFGAAIQVTAIRFEGYYTVPPPEPAQAPQGPSPASVGSGASTILRITAAQPPQGMNPAPVQGSNSPPLPPNMAGIEDQAVALWNEKRYSEAAPFLIQACNYDRAYTCYYLGSMYNLGQGVAKDTEKGKQLLSRACSLGYERACDGIK